MAQKKKTVEFFKQTAPAKKVVKKVETDEILEGVDKFEYLLSQYWKPIAGGVAAIAVIVVALIIIQAVRTDADRKLRGEFAAANTIDALETVISANAQHPSAFDAGIRLAQLYTAEKNYSKAYETLQKAAAIRNLDPYLSVKAGILAAYQLENAGKTAEAVQEFTNLANDPNATEGQRTEAVFSAARLSAKLGKTADAERLLATVTVNPQSQDYWQLQCAALKKQIGK